MNHREKPLDVIRMLKGAPAAVFLAQVLHGSPQTVRMLCGHTGYSDKVVRQGLSHLESMGLAYRDSELRAWYLVPGTEVLALLRGALATVETADPPYHVQEEMTATTEEFPAAPLQDVPPVPEARSGGSEINTAPREDFTGDREGSSSDGQEISVSRAHAFTTSTTLKPSNYVDQEVVSKYAHPKHETNGRDPAAKVNGKLMFWLSRGGIAPGSPKMREIMALDPDLEVVKAHVLERLACVQGEAESTKPFGVGLLIRKLLDGDPPPPMRCETCLRLPDHRGWCRCDYDDVVIR